jgi:hypothetical protein
MPALERRGSIEYTPPVSSFSPWSPVPVKLSTANVIFVFITDMGGDALTNLTLSYGSRKAIPQTLLRNTVKRALDKEWQRLRLGRVISEVVPFFPLEPEGIREVLWAKLRALAVNKRTKDWAELQVDDGVVMHMSDPTMVHYQVYNATSGVTKVFAEWGGNAIMKGTALSNGLYFSLPVFLHEVCFPPYFIGSLQDLKNLLHRHATPPRPGTCSCISSTGLLSDVCSTRRSHPARGAAH